MNRSITTLINRARTILTALVVVFSCVAVLKTATCYAEEAKNRFSLGYGNLTTAPADPKAPEPGGVTAKYGFSFAKDFKPYVGTGLAYSFQPEIKPGDTRKIRAGVAGQAGFSYLLGTNSSFNIDYKYFNVAPDATRNDSKSTPQSVGVGLEIKF